MTKHPSRAHDSAAAAEAPDETADAPSQAEKDADKEPLKREDAEQLLRSGHRLRRKGDDPKRWFAMSRHGEDLVICLAGDPDTIAHFLDAELLLAE